jgi:hypothetical protein
MAVLGKARTDEDGESQNKKEHFHVSLYASGSERPSLYSAIPEIGIL